MKTTLSQRQELRKLIEQAGGTKFVVSEDWEGFCVLFENGTNLLNGHAPFEFGNLPVSIDSYELVKGHQKIQ